MSKVKETAAEAEEGRENLIAMIPHFKGCPVTPGRQEVYPTSGYLRDRTPVQYRVARCMDCGGQTEQLIEGVYSNGYSAG